MCKNKTLIDLKNFMKCTLKMEHYNFLTIVTCVSNKNTIPFQKYILTLKEPMRLRKKFKLVFWYYRNLIFIKYLINYKYYIIILKCILRYHFSK